MNKWTKRCALVAFVLGLLVAGPVPAFAAEPGQLPNGVTELARLDETLAAIDAAVASILAAEPEQPTGPPAGPPIPVPGPVPNSPSAGNGTH